MIPEDAASVSHLQVVTGSFLDRKASVPWVEVGTVPSGGIQTVFGKVVEGLGAFTDANYYKINGSELGTDSLDYSGDFTITMVLKAVSQDRYVFNNGATGVSGYGLITTSGAAGRIGLNYHGATQVGETGATILDGAPHVVSFGRRAGNAFLCVDNRAVRTQAIGAHTVGTNRACNIGRYDTAGNAFDGQVYEVRVLPAGLSDVDLAALHAAVMA
jgi:hypothetical protein